MIYGLALVYCWSGVYSKASTCVVLIWSWVDPWFTVSRICYSIYVEFYFALFFTFLLEIQYVHKNVIYAVNTI